MNAERADLRCFDLPGLNLALSNSEDQLPQRLSAAKKSFRFCIPKTIF
jgi:hypothetical protein